MGLAKYLYIEHVVEMNFYTDKNNRQEASPCNVRMGNTYLYFQDDDAYPIIITRGGSVKVGPATTEHWELAGGETPAVQARLWLNTRILTVWNDYVSAEAMSKIANVIQKKFNLSPDQVRFVFDGYRYISRDEYENIVCELPLSEYIKLNPSMSLNNFVLLYYDREQKLKANGYVPDPAKNGMDKKDIWRHYKMVGESKTIKLSEKQLRKVIAESIKKLTAHL